jgi:rhodanese-related sulfurtransferase
MALVVSVAVFVGAAIPPAHSQSLKETACRIFQGKAKCGETIAVVDAGACIVTVRSKSFENLDPADAGCLIESIGAKRLFLRGSGRTISITRKTAVNSVPVRASIRVTGPGVVQVMTGYDKHGAPIWTPQNSSVFEVKGDVAASRRAVAHLKRDLCGITPAATLRPATPRTMSVQRAFQSAARGEIVLIDIRRQSEWRQTGVGTHAVAITMHQNFADFARQARALAAQRGNKPIALICASGGRSSRLQKRLAKHGISGVIDVHEGMVGGFHGPGWINSGLPVRPYPAKSTPQK